MIYAAINNTVIKKHVLIWPKWEFYQEADARLRRPR